MNPEYAEKMRTFRAAGLYVVTSRALSCGRSTEDIVERALRGGCRLIQLREKDISTAELTRLAAGVRRLTAMFDALFIMNDRLDVALAVKADGVHLGRQDLPVSSARAIAPELIIGASSHNVEEACRAQTEGASYVNIGPVFPTKTKEWTDAFLGVEGVRRVAPLLTIPFTVMGGIKKGHIRELLATGATALAVVTAVTSAPDPEQATRALLADIHAARRDAR